MAMKRAKEQARRLDERARLNRKRLRGDEEHETVYRELPARPMSLVFGEQLQNKDSPVVSTLVSVARQFVASGGGGGTSKQMTPALQSYLARHCLCTLRQWQEESLQFAQHRERDTEGVQSRGLILAHEPGLGKTLIALEHCLRDNQAKARLTGRRFNGGATLVVCKDELVLQNWLYELRSKWSPGTFYYYHLQSSGGGSSNGGAHRRVDPLYLAYCCDVVLATYATVRCAYKYGTRNAAMQVDGGENDEEGDDDAEQTTDERDYKYAVLYGIRWARVVADEGHLFVNAATLLFRAMVALRAAIKWSVTGTPLLNSWQSICSSLLFIGCDTSALLDRHSDAQAPSEQELDRLDTINRIVLFRRTRADLGEEDAKLMSFGALTKRIRLIEFESPLERLVYYQYAVYGAQRGSSGSGVGNGGTNVAYLIQMMIQLCSNLAIVPDLVLPHGMLTMRGARQLQLAPSDFDEALFPHDVALHSAEQTLQGFAARLGRATRFTYSARQNLVGQASDYLVEYRASLADAPVSLHSSSVADHNQDELVWDPYARSVHFDVTRNKLDRADYRALYKRLRRDEDDGLGDARVQAMRAHILKRTLPRDYRSTKNRHVCEYVREAPPADKIIVFSSSIKALHALQRDLAQDGWRTTLISGETPKENGDRLRAFADDAGLRVLLLSLKLGAMALNITCANHILFLHPWWNPAVLDQGEKRIDRMGQTKPMFITHFIMNRTLELYMANLAYNKNSVTSGIIDQGTTATATVTTTTTTEPLRKKRRHNEGDGEANTATTPDALSYNFAEYSAVALSDANGATDQWF